jgi:energy-coupling factor transporter ATP-binding protein EcfA2
MFATPVVYLGLSGAASTQTGGQIRFLVGDTMALLETLTLGLGPALAKAVLKLWLPEKSLSLAVGDGVVEILKKRGEQFATVDATDRLFRNLASEVAERLYRTIEIEFPRLPESDRDAAVLAVADVFQRLDLSRDMMRADLNAAGLEQIARPEAKKLFASLGGDAQALAELVLRESAAYAVTVAGKLPDFQVAATRELLKRTGELMEELTRVLDIVGSMREQAGRNDVASGFETQYRRAISHRLDRMQLFGVRLVGAGAREPEISVAYVTLTSAHQRSTKSSDVDSSLASLTRVVVRGEAGSGKTTLLQWLAIRAARTDFTGVLESWNARMPLYISLRDYTSASFPPPEEFVASIAPNLVALMPAGWVQGVLAGGALVLIDGVDEVPAAKRGDLFDWLRDLVADFPESTIILSSRPAALDAKGPGGTAMQRLAKLGFEQITLEPLSLADSEALISQWHRAVGRDLVEDEEVTLRLERYERDLIRVLHDRPVIRSLASNPLLCAMICVLNWDRQQRLPDNRMELYGLALEMLIDARDADRKIKAARLSELDRSSKEALLDGIAYWMMRNGASEADRSEVESQIASLIQRLARVPQNAGEVLQELLERSGVLREPQSGIVDFVHRTFLEYMAARAAVAAGDLGLLADKAREDGWRETIVFAAGHAQGLQRDQMIAKLLKTPFFALRGRSVEADVTAACCLETASANLDPALLDRLRACAKNLFPPRNVETARVLGPAANLAPSLLKGHQNSGENAVAACIRCASIVGGDRMLDVVETYADYPGERVWMELITAWTAFDPDEYQQRVIRKRTEQNIGGIKLPELDADSARCLQLLVVKGMHDKSSEELSKAIKRFVADRSLSIGGRVYENEDLAEHTANRGGVLSSFWRSRREFAPAPTKRVTALDAMRIANISSLRCLRLRTSDPGVIEAICGLPSLQELHCSPANPEEIVSLLKLQALVKLHIDGFREFDLRPLAQCAALKRLKVDFATALRLPVGLLLDELDLTFVPLPAISELKLFPSLTQVRVHVDELPGDFDLTYLNQLRNLQIIARKPFTIKLPSSLEKLDLSDSPSIEIANAAELIKLKELTLFSNATLTRARCLLELPSLKAVFLFDKNLDREVSKQLIDRGVNVHRF